MAATLASSGGSSLAPRSFGPMVFTWQAGAKAVAAGSTALVDLVATSTTSASRTALDRVGQVDGVQAELVTGPRGELARFAGVGELTRTSLNGAHRAGAHTAAPTTGCRSR